MNTAPESPTNHPCAYCAPRRAAIAWSVTAAARDATAAAGLPVRAGVSSPALTAAIAAVADAAAMAADIAARANDVSTAAGGCYMVAAAVTGAAKYAAKASAAWSAAYALATSLKRAAAANPTPA